MRDFLIINQENVVREKEVEFYPKLMNNKCLCDKFLSLYFKIDE